MITPFERFCITHACARWCIGQKNFCPLAAFSMLTYGGVDWRRCERIFKELEKRNEKYHIDKAEYRGP